MSKRLRKSGWFRNFERQWSVLNRLVGTTARQTLTPMLKPPARARAATGGTGSWTLGVAALGLSARRYRLYRPAGVKPGERLPLVVMLHGCGQDAAAFAASTGMNRLAQRERCLVLYPEQDRYANVQGCWNWYETDNGRAYSEAALILQAIDQVSLVQPVDRQRVALVGLSAGASMAALLATRYPQRFCAVVMHSGIPPGTAHSGLSALGAMRGTRATMAPAPGAVAWPPLLVIHGDADGVVAPANGRAAAQSWAQTAGARATAARQLQRGQRYPMTVTDFRHQGRTAATLVSVHGLAHAWSGGAAAQPNSDPRGPDAARLAWAFMARQFKTPIGGPRRAAGLKTLLQTEPA